MRRRCAIWLACGTSGIVVVVYHRTLSAVKMIPPRRPGKEPAEDQSIRQTTMTQLDDAKHQRDLARAMRASRQRAEEEGGPSRGTRSGGAPADVGAGPSSPPAVGPPLTRQRAREGGDASWSPPSRTAPGGNEAGGAPPLRVGALRVPIQRPTPSEGPGSISSGAPPLTRQQLRDRKDRYNAILMSRQTDAKGRSQGRRSVFRDVSASPPRTRPPGGAQATPSTSVFSGSTRDTHLSLISTSSTEQGPSTPSSEEAATPTLSAEIPRAARLGVSLSKNERDRARDAVLRIPEVSRFPPVIYFRSICHNPCRIQVPVTPTGGSRTSDVLFPKLRLFIDWVMESNRPEWNEETQSYRWGGGVLDLHSDFLCSSIAGLQEAYDGHMSTLPHEFEAESQMYCRHTDGKPLSMDTAGGPRFYELDPWLFVAFLVGNDGKNLVVSSCNLLAYALGSQEFQGRVYGLLQSSSNRIILRGTPEAPQHGVEHIVGGDEYGEFAEVGQLFAALTTQGLCIIPGVRIQQAVADKVVRLPSRVRHAGHTYDMPLQAAREMYTGTSRPPMEQMRTMLTWMAGPMFAMRTPWLVVKPRYGGSGKGVLCIANDPLRVQDMGGRVVDPAIVQIQDGAQLILQAFDLSLQRNEWRFWIAPAIPRGGMGPHGHVITQKVWTGWHNQMEVHEDKLQHAGAAEGQLGYSEDHDAELEAATKAVYWHISQENGTAGRNRSGTFLPPIRVDLYMGQGPRVHVSELETAFSGETWLESLGQAGSDDSEMDWDAITTFVSSISRIAIAWALRTGHLADAE